MKHEKFMRAMGEIDEDLIMEAHEERHAKMIWIRFAACAACFALLAIVAPRAIQVAEDSFATGEMEADGAFDNDILGGAETDLIEAPAFDKEDGVEEEIPSDEAIAPSESKPQSGLTNGEEDTAELIEQLQMLQVTQALKEQGGAYPIGTAIKNQYGEVTLTDRIGTVVSMRVILYSDFQLSAFSATSGVWRIRVNGAATEEFPDKAGAYEIEIDFSGDPNLDMIYVARFGVFSIDTW